MTLSMKNWSELLLSAWVRCDRAALNRPKQARLRRMQERHSRIQYEEQRQHSQSQPYNQNQHQFTSHLLFYHRKTRENRSTHGEDPVGLAAAELVSEVDAVVEVLPEAEVVLERAAACAFCLGSDEFHLLFSSEVQQVNPKSLPNVGSVSVKIKEERFLAWAKQSISPVDIIFKKPAFLREGKEILEGLSLIDKNWGEWIGTYSSKSPTIAIPPETLCNAGNSAFLSSGLSNRMRSPMTFSSFLQG